MNGKLIFPALLAALIIGSYFETKLMLIFLVILCLRVLILKNWSLNFLMILVAGIFFLRCTAIAQEHQPVKPQDETAIFAYDKISVNGDLLSGEMQTDNQAVRFLYRLKSVQEQHYWQNLSGMVQANLEVKGIEPIKGPRNIGEFDFLKYSENKNLHYSVQIEALKNLQNYHPATMIGKINVLRIHIIKYLASLPHWLRIHAQSLLVGYTESTDRYSLKILSILGVIHLFSLSGLHVLILLTIIRKITSLMKIPIEWIDLLMLVLLPAYGMLVGSKSGIWRAIVLAMLGIISKKINWNLSRLDIFSLTFLVCLLIYPFAIVEMGGQLSFVLSFAILYLYQKAPLWITTLKMNLVSLPLICFYTYQFNWLTWLANIFFVPFFSYVILPITLISSMTVHWSIWKNFDKFFDALYTNLDKISSNQNFIFVTGKFPSWLVLLLVIIVIFYVESHEFWNKYLIQFTVLFVICVILNKFPLFGTVTIIDVGQGDSILITTPIKRQVFLIDVGGKLSFPTKPWAKRISRNQIETTTLPFLKSQGISHIDKVFLTHNDVDHVGNIATLLAEFPVNEVNFGTGLEENARIKAMIQQYPQIKFKSRRQGDVLDTGFIKWQVLWPKVKSVGENGDSLTMLARIKNKNWLFTGDLDQQGESEILSEYQLKVDYLKVGHHGSRTSTSEALLKQTQPKLGLISSGVNNRYGHPNKETVERLQQHGVQYFNTADYGMISWYYYFFDDKEKLTTFLKGDLFENNGIKK